MTRVTQLSSATLITSDERNRSMGSPRNLWWPSTLTSSGLLIPLTLKLALDTGMHKMIRNSSTARGMRDLGAGGYRYGDCGQVSLASSSTVRNLSGISDRSTKPSVRS